MLKGNDEDLDFIDASPDASPRYTNAGNTPRTMVRHGSMIKNSQEDIISSTASNIFHNNPSRNEMSGDDNSEVDSMFRSLINRSDEIEFHNNVKKMKEIMEEEDQILQYLVNKVPKCETISDLIDYLEAFFYERKIRLTDKNKILENFSKIVSGKQDKINQCETLIKRLSYEIKLFKQLGEIKNLRHAGLWKEHRGSLGMDMPEIDEVSMTQEMSFIPGDLDNGAMARMGSKNSSPLKIGFNNNGDSFNMDNGVVGDSSKDEDDEDSGVYDWIVDIDMISKVNFFMREGFNFFRCQEQDGQSSLAETSSKIATKQSKEMSLVILNSLALEQNIPKTTIRKLKTP